MDERVSEAGPGVLPEALISDVIRIEAQRHASLLTAHRVACAQVEQVIAGHAHSVVACGLLTTGVAPAGHQMQAAAVRQGYIGKERGAHVRYIDYLLSIECGCAGIVGDGADRRG